MFGKSNIAKMYAATEGGNTRDAGHTELVVVSLPLCPWAAIQKASETIQGIGGLKSNLAGGGGSGKGHGRNETQATVMTV